MSQVSTKLAKLREQIAAFKREIQELEAQPRSRAAVADSLERALRAARGRGLGALQTAAALIAAGHAADPLAARGVVAPSGTFRVDLGAVVALALSDEQIRALVAAAVANVPEGVDPEERRLRLDEDRMALDDLELAEEREVTATGAARRADARPEIILAAS